jgi:DNA-binding MarR family transcriptional regulator
MNKPPAGNKPRPRAAKARGEGPIVTVLIGTVPVNRLTMPLARRFNQVCLAASADLLRPDGLVPLQYAVLAYLHHQPGIDQRGLAARMAVDRTNAGLLIDQMEKRALAERYMDPADRRVRLLRLTAEGEALFQKYAAQMRALNRALLESALSPDEADRFLEMLVRVIQANEALAKPGLGRRRRASRRSSDARGRTMGG